MNIHEHPDYSLKKAIAIYALAVLFLFYEMGLQVSPSVIAFDLMRDFKIDSAALGLMAGCYFYSYSIMQLPAGLLFDRFGARLLITLAILICLSGAFFFGYTEDVFWASVARFLMGFGSAFAFTGVLVVSAFWFKPHHFAFLAGMAQFFAGLGAVGGAYPMAVLVRYFGWRDVMLILAVAGVVLAILAWLVIRDHPRKKLAKNIVATPNIKESISKVFSQGQNWLAALSAFTAWGPVPLFAALWGGPFLQTKFHVSNELAASSISMIWIGMALGSPFLGWLSDYIKRRVIIMSVCALLGLGTTLCLIYINTIPFGLTYVLLFILGFSACSQLLTFAVIKDRNKPTILATAMGFNNMAVVMGGAIFQPVVGIILDYFKDRSGQMSSSLYTTYEFKIALALMPLCYLIYFLVTVFFLKETHCKTLYLTKSENKE